MNKYYIVTEDLMDDLFTLDLTKVTYLDKHSAIIYTELTLKELQEHLQKLEPKIPY